MTDFQHIYTHQADWYDRLVACEDSHGRILTTLQQIRPLTGLDVVEFGAGTGRLTQLLTPHVRRIIATDASAAMLAVARHNLSRTTRANWHTAVADNRAMPLPAHCADLVIEGWSFGHLTGWYPHTWAAELARAIHEMRRLLRPGGTLILLETLGTGQETPHPPTTDLATMYQLLEQQHGCQHTWIRTDYAFPSVAEAERLLRFFFGNALADTAVAQQQTHLPECTGIWWQTQPAS